MTLTFRYGNFFFTSNCTLEQIGRSLTLDDGTEYGRLKYPLGQALEYFDKNNTFRIYSQDPKLIEKSYNLRIHYTVNDRRKQSTFIEFTLAFRDGSLV